VGGEGLFRKKIDKNLFQAGNKGGYVVGKTTDLILGVLYGHQIIKGFLFEPYYLNYKFIEVWVTPDNVETTNENGEKFYRFQSYGFSEYTKDESTFLCQEIGFETFSKEKSNVDGWLPEGAIRTVIPKWILLRNMSKGIDPQKYFAAAEYASFLATEKRFTLERAKFESGKRFGIERLVF